MSTTTTTNVTTANGLEIRVERGLTARRRSHVPRTAREPLPRKAPVHPLSADVYYGTSRPFTKSWIALAARPAESTLSLPARVLMSS